MFELAGNFRSKIKCLGKLKGVPQFFATPLLFKYIAVWAFTVNCSGITQVYAQNFIYSGNWVDILVFIYC